ncbi:CCHC-type domain-containing protein [Nephila pilipes]|uniref:CCHC-type domain-containing protein n=1 Tax=Nephila pilipes TaxID=299642 RepID=A0A8X6TMU0_NEPPI|nr:CCHC-type domain-containing protein [Nephila pilipes]
MDEETDLEFLIRKIVKVAVLRLVNQTDKTSDLHSQSSKEIVYYEFERVMAPVIAKPLETRRRPAYMLPVTRNSTIPIPRPTMQPKKTDIWKTFDNRPVGFHCGRPGHCAIAERGKRFLTVIEPVDRTLM